ncbi:hypothetical protein OIU78_010728, partial [Salix suchowensis]
MPAVLPTSSPVLGFCAECKNLLASYFSTLSSMIINVYVCLMLD